MTASSDVGLFFDRQGRPIDIAEFEVLYRDPGYKIVARSERGGVLVSTVWACVNHAFAGGPPLIFETMVFGGPRDQELWRYSTEAEALAGHAEICSVVLR